VEHRAGDLCCALCMSCEHCECLSLSVIWVPDQWRALRACRGTCPRERAGAAAFAGYYCVAPCVLWLWRPCVVRRVCAHVWLVIWREYIYSVCPIGRSFLVVYWMFVLAVLSSIVVKKFLDIRIAYPLYPHQSDPNLTSRPQPFTLSKSPSLAPLMGYGWMSWGEMPLTLHTQRAHPLSS
jgi:hypothetical protein